MTPEQYQQHVLGLLAATFPDEEFGGSPDPFLIKHGAAELGLRNLYALHTRKEFEPEERDAHIREHVWRILRRMAAQGRFSFDVWWPDDLRGIVEKVRNDRSLKVK